MKPTRLALTDPNLARGLSALKRAAAATWRLSVETGTPFYVTENRRVVDRNAARKKPASKRSQVPKSGMIAPNMGSLAAREPGRGLTRALFTPVQQRVLGLLFGQPDRVFQSAELIRLAGSGTGAVHRQLQRLATTGLVLVSRAGNQKYYRVNKESPIYPELHGLVVKTVGLVEPLRDALAPLADRIRVAFIFGSVAKGRDRADSDLDLLVIADDLAYADVYTALQGAEARLARSINPTVMTAAEWKQKRSRDSFAARVGKQPKVFVIGSEDALG